MKTKQITENTDNGVIFATYSKLLRQSRSIITGDSSKIIKKAFRISLDAHKNMRRKSGEYYILHQ